MLHLFKPRQLLSKCVTLTETPVPDRFRVGGMITHLEYSALAAFAAQVWTCGAPRDGAIIDGGSFIGASTTAFAEGLRQSPLTESERWKRIWSYDLFRATPVMASHYLKGRGILPGGSFRHIYDANIKDVAPYIQTYEGDMLTAPRPDGPVAILFLDVVWSWDAARKLADQFYPLLHAKRSILIHQDFVYPFYPWVILSMGLLSKSFAFAQNVPYSSVVFDVSRRYRAGALDDLRNIPEHQAIIIYDDFIARLDGWAKGALGLGKALFLASRYQVDAASRMIADIETTFRDEQLVMQWVPGIKQYCEDARTQGFARPLEEVVGQ